MNWDTTKGWTDSVSGMFEGMINYDPHVGLSRGDISLAIPNDSTRYIDTDTYSILSFGIAGYNPNQAASLGACAMHIRWKDTSDTWHGWCSLLSGTGYSVGNGWDSWSTVGPIDLSTVSGLEWDSTSTAKELWIRFQAGIQVYPYDTVDIRIGWIRLEESGQ